MYLPHLQNVSIQQNTADGMGGAIFLASHSIGRINNSVIEDNVAKELGGCVYLGEV